MRKRILSILLTLCMVLCLVPTAVFAEGGTASADITGTGAADDPYLIYTAAGLKAFRDKVNGQYGLTKQPGAHATLMNDIVLNNGTFDGGGHTIKGLYVKGARFAGLFGSIYQGTVKNVTVTGYVEGVHNVGGIVGYGNGATVIGCTNAATVKGGWFHVGGIVGWLYEGNVRNCANLGSVRAQIDSERENAYVGGIAGYVKFSETIADCYNAGSIAIQDSGTGKNTMFLILAAS